MNEKSRSNAEEFAELCLGVLDILDLVPDCPLVLIDFIIISTWVALVPKEMHCIPFFNEL